MVANFDHENDHGIRFLRYLQINSSDVDEMSDKNITNGSDKEDGKDFLIEGTATGHELVGNGATAANQNLQLNPVLKDNGSDTSDVDRITNGNDIHTKESTKN